MKQWIKKAAVATVVAGGAVVARAQSSDANVTAVTSGVGTLTTVFGTVFALGVAVVIAMIAKKYLRRAA